MDETPRKSKKPSGTRAEWLLETTVFFVDRCLGRRVPEALRKAGFKIECHEDHFADDLEDEVWLPEVGVRGWVVFTKDKQIRKRPAEREALILSGVRLFTLPSGNLTSDQMIEILIQNRLEIGRFLKNNRAPFAARVSSSGVASIKLS